MRKRSTTCGRSADTPQSATWGATMGTEQKPFRILSIRELRELSSLQRAEYLGQLAVYKLQQAADLEQSATPVPAQPDEPKDR